LTVTTAIVEDDVKSCNVKTDVLLKVTYMDSVNKRNYVKML
jgi:hypothetical protein